MNAGQFQPGQPKPENSGRKPGTPNIRAEKINETMADIVDDLMPYLRAIMISSYKSPIAPRSEFINGMVKMIALLQPKGGLKNSRYFPNVQENQQEQVTEEREEEKQVPNTPSA